MGSVSQTLAKHGVAVRRGEREAHRRQAIVERFNRTIAYGLFGHQYAQELLDSSRGSTEWVRRLPAVVAALHNEVSRLTSKKPSLAIRERSVIGAAAAPARRQVGLEEQRLL